MFILKVSYLVTYNNHKESIDGCSRNESSL